MKVRFLFTWYRVLWIVLAALGIANNVHQSSVLGAAFWSVFLIIASGDVIKVERKK